MNKIRDYNIIKLLGEGGMGSVYLAEEELTERKVAVKILHPQLTKNENFKNRFIREAKILAQLKHPNIVGLLALFEENESYCMVMEYFEGETLKEMIRRRGPIPEDEVRDIARQIFYAVNKAHNRDIVHRDLKPSNILIDKGNKVGILDFGIAKILADADYTRTGTLLGTLYYMSPEQIKGEKTIDHRTDIYSIGVTLYEMLAGRLPFETPTEISEFARGEISRQIVNEDFPDPRKFYPHISDEIVTAIQGMIRKEKTGRPDNCGECIKLLDEKISLNEVPEISAHDSFEKKITVEEEKKSGGGLTNLADRDKKVSRIWIFIIVGALIIISFLMVYNKIEEIKKENARIEREKISAEKELEEMKKKERLNQEILTDYNKFSYGLRTKLGSIGYSPSKTLINDDFSYKKYSWDDVNNGEKFAKIESGTYRVKQIEKNYSYWPGIDKYYNFIIIRAAVKLVGNSLNSMGGLYFTSKKNKDYFFGISGDQDQIYSFGYYDNNLTSNQWIKKENSTYSTYLNKTGSNTLESIVTGNTIYYFINGNFVKYYNYNESISGNKIGFYVNSNGVEYTFDNVLVMEIKK